MTEGRLPYRTPADVLDFTSGVCFLCGSDVDLVVIDDQCLHDGKMICRACRGKAIEEYAEGL